jgi:hypothetical protein
MALGFNATTRNAWLDSITTRAGASAKMRIYDGTRPATGGAATTLLAELICNATFAPAASGGVLTLNAIANDASADATGTATWFRLVQTDGSTHVFDGNVATSASDLNLNTTSIVSGGPVAISSFTITAPNA